MLVWRPIMDRVATHDDMAKRDLYWLLNLNEMMDVWRDYHDLDVRKPYPPGFTGTEFV